MIFKSFEKFNDNSIIWKKRGFYVLLESHRTVTRIVYKLLIESKLFSYNINFVSITVAYSTWIWANEFYWVYLRNNILQKTLFHVLWSSRCSICAQWILSLLSTAVVLSHFVRIILHAIGPLSLFEVYAILLVEYENWEKKICSRSRK